LSEGAVPACFFVSPTYLSCLNDSSLQARINSSKVVF
jgi:hypothetical protein